MSEQTIQNAETPSAQHPTQVQTLWMLACHIEGCHAHRLVPFYAISQEEADRQAEQWLAQQPCSMVRLSLRNFPDGFVICRQRLIGTIEE